MRDPIIQLSPSKKAAFLSFMFKDAALAAGIIFMFTLLFLPVGLLFLDAGMLGLIGGSTLILIEFMVFLAMTFKVMNSYQYVFYEDHIELKKGVLDKEQVSIQYNEITNINEWQGIYQRFFGTATIDIHTAGGDGKIVKRGIIDKERDVKPEMQLNYIKEHEQLYEILNSRINNPEYTDHKTKENSVERQIKPDLKAALIPKAVSGLFVGLITFAVFLGRSDLSGTIAAGVAGFSALGSAFIRLMNLRSRTYTFDANQIEINEGFLNNKKDTISYDRVTDVTFSKPIIQRIFGTGTLIVNTAGSSKQKFKISYISEPEKTHNELSDIISKVKYKPSH